jgi:hypothetical protein
MPSALKLSPEWGYWGVSGEEHDLKPPYGLPVSAAPRHLRVRSPQRSASDALRLTSDEVREAFDRYRIAWQLKSETMSSLTDMVLLPEYQHIIGLGRPAVPYIIESLRTELDHWFWALKSIVGVDHAEGAETMREAADKWIAWYDSLAFDDQPG